MVKMIVAIIRTKLDVVSIKYILFAFIDTIVH